MQNVSKKPNSNNLLVASATVILLLFVATLYFHSIRERKAEYGDKWKQSVYTINPFQIDTANDIQKSIHEWNLSHGIKGEEGTLIEAMTIGYKNTLSKATKTSFSRSGVSHILALSGFHVTIIYLLLDLICLSRLVAFRYRWFPHLLTLILLWIYAFIAGMSPSLVRAVITCTIFTISKLHTNKLLSFRALSISAIVMLLIEPLLIFHVGFQLSFLSMIGIYILGVPLCEAYQGYTFLDRFIWCAICLTLTCSLFTFPLVAYTFHQVPLLGLFTNIIITILTYLLFLLLPLYILTLGASTITDCMMTISHWILQVTDHISTLPYSSLHWQPTIPTLILIYSLIGILTVILKRNIRPELRKKKKKKETE